MTKFKVGDVVVVKENTSGGHPAGTIAKVIGVRPSGGVDIIGLPGSRYTFSLVHDKGDLRKIAKFDKAVSGADQKEVLNIKPGDVVIIKENRSGGHSAGTLGRVKSVSFDGGQVQVAELSKGWGKTYLHTMKELRKIKGYDK